jgi:hypothetical protein
MQRKHSTKYFCNHGDAQPWDSYVTSTSSSNNDQGDNAKNKRPKRWYQMDEDLEIYYTQTTGLKVMDMSIISWSLSITCPNAQ